ncbi:porphobilinogen deaminase [Aureobasidium sp. EXF-8845]|nr:porphobilinogen deaminase [Aureobasidium sp. EXF-8845]KAI4856349.1 porphobilinogen deaminase [Aureobasidium sp. EXF-8846]
MAPPQETRVVNIGTRRSQLAIAQVDMVVKHLQTFAPGPEYKSQVVSTMADENQVKSFQEFNAKSIWTEELEKLLMEKKLDVIVHCLKDVPTTLPESCILGIICEREDPRDVMVMKQDAQHKTLQALPPGSIVGTSSVRRKAQIMRHFSHLICEDVRGNVNTRLRKLDAEDSPYACLILAAAGLKRIDLGYRITQYLGPEDGMLYAPGQGALALEVREGDEETLKLLSSLSHQTTTLACLAEKSLLRTLEGGCSAPVGVHTVWEGDLLVLHSTVTSLDGKQMVEMSKKQTVTTIAEAEALGKDLADSMIAEGANTILEEIRAGLR